MEEGTDPVVCMACGVIHDEATGLLRQLRQDLDSAERDLRAKRRQISALREEQYAQLTASPHFRAANEVLAYWKEKLAPNTRELGGRRMLAAIGRLRGGYQPADLKRCVDGYALMPYVVNGRRSPTGRAGERKIDAELIFRDPQHVDAGLAWVQERQDEQLALDTVGTEQRPISTNGHRHHARAEQIARYATGLGFAVFPCVPDRKVPATPDGFKAATRDPDRIKTYWSQNPRANVATATGAISQIVVIDLDVDVEEGVDGRDVMAQLEHQHGDLPATLMAVTPRKGVHLYFRHPGKVVRNAVGVLPGLDVRGDGGYVLLPDSSVAGNSYVFEDRSPIAEFPSWLLELLAAQATPSTNGSFDWAGFITAGAAQGQRDNRMTKFVGHLYGRGLPADEVIALARVLNANVKPPLDLQDLQRIVQSIGRAEARKER
jgi:hypothetical protein